MKLLIEIYGVTDQRFYDEYDNIKTIYEMFDELQAKFNQSHIKSKIELKLIDVLKDEYDNDLAKKILSEKKLLPWIFFNGELEFYNGFSIPMIYNEALKEMSYKIKRPIPNGITSE